MLIHFTYLALRLEIGTGRDERVHHRRVPFVTGPVKRFVAILSVGSAHGAGVGFSQEGREGRRRVVSTEWEGGDGEGRVHC